MDIVLETREFTGSATVHHQDFNEIFCRAFDESISGMLGERVLTSLYAVLHKHYSVSRDELPYRLETVYAVLEKIFAVNGSRTIEKNIVRRFYNKLGLAFNEVDGYSLKDYLESAERKI